MRDQAAGFVKFCPDAIVGVTLDGCISVWNPAAERLYGFSAAEMLGQSLVAIVPPDRTAGAWALLARVGRGEVPGEQETVRRTKDGRLMDISLALFPAYDAHGEVIGAFATVRDITGVKQVARDLENSEHLFRAAFEDAPNGMTLVGLDGQILRVNRASCELLGRDAADLVNTSAITLVSDSQLRENAIANIDLVEGKRRSYSMDTWIVRPDGSPRWLRSHTSLIRDSEGNPLYYLGQAYDRTEEVVSREQLDTVSEQLQDALNRAGGAMFELDAGLRITRANASAGRLVSRPPESLVGQAILDVLGQGYVDTLMPTIQAAIQERQSQPAIETLCPVTARWFSAQIDTLAGGVSLLMQDVTTLHEIRERLRVSEMRFQTLVEQLPAGVYSHGADDDHAALYYSPRLLQMLGYASEDPYPLHNVEAWKTQVHPHDLDRILGEVATMVTAPPGQSVIEYRLRRKDGSYIWVQDYHGPLWSDDGQQVAWLGVIIDVTERKQISVMLARMAAIVEAADSPIYTRTIDGRITYWNPAAERLYGYSREEAIGQSITILFPDEADQLITDPGILMVESPARFQVLHRCKDGSLVDTEVVLFPVHYDNGEVFSIAGICQDISGRIAAERTLQQALAAAEAGSRAKSLFLTMMSHELRTPLQSILGYAELLLHDTQHPLPPLQHEDVGLIHDGARRMDRLITQLLDLSRMQVDRLALQLEPVDIGQVLAQVNGIVAPRSAAHGVQLAISAPAGLPLVLGDAERILQILLNLADNAFKFTEKGQVSVTVRTTHEWMDIAVKDTGIGIAPADMAHIFDEFRQVEDILTRRRQGAGLGLAIARRLAGQMGGEIVVASELGVGSTFTLRLPLAPEMHPAAVLHAGRGLAEK
ncbi:MAG: PAS domain S-box protein [Thermomicrobiales bacterium]